MQSKFERSKRIMGTFRKIGMKPDEIQAIMLIMIADSLNTIAEKLAGKDE